jgi:hypothetical protein
LSSHDIDWRLTAYVALSFAMHSFWLGTMFSDAMDPVVGDTLMTAGLLDTAHKTNAVVETAPHDSVPGVAPTGSTISIAPTCLPPVAPWDWPPIIEVRHDALSMSVRIANAPAVVRSQIEPGARRCYARYLDQERARLGSLARQWSRPTALVLRPGKVGPELERAGRLELAIDVAPDGEVAGVGVGPESDLPPPVIQCTASVTRRAHFDPPGLGGSAVRVWLVFTSSQ